MPAGRSGPDEGGQPGSLSPVGVPEEATPGPQEEKQDPGTLGWRDSARPGLRLRAGTRGRTPAPESSVHSDPVALSGPTSTPQGSLEWHVEPTLPKPPVVESPSPKRAQETHERGTVSEAW